MKILIVDDDKLIRNWLSLLLAQIEEYELTLHEASDGEEALKICRQNPMDLVFTDIKMPRMDGLQLIEKLHKHCPHTKTAVLSSYDDLAYVRTALKHRSLDYILKPEMNLADLSEILARAERLEPDANIALTKGEIENLRTRNQMFQNFLDEPAGGRAFLEHFPWMQGGNLRMAAFSLGDSLGNKGQFLAQKLCDGILHEAYVPSVTYALNSGDLLVIYQSKETIPEYRISEYRYLHGLWQDALEQRLGSKIAYSIDVFCSNVEEMREKLTNLLRLMHIRAYYGHSIGSLELSYVDSTMSAVLVGKIKKNIDLGDARQALTIFRQCLEKLHEEQYYPGDVKALAAYCITVFFMYNWPPEAKGGPMGDYYARFISRIQAAGTQRELNLLVNDFTKFYLEKQASNVQGLSPTIEKALEYIDENYMHKLTLGDVAAKVYLSRSYFGQLFRRETGKGFVEHLESVRLLNAVELLRNTDLPVSDVAEKVGFRYQNYFTKVFKERLGKTPLQYRKIHF